jgi:hypothetical protein
VIGMLSLVEESIHNRFIQLARSAGISIEEVIVRDPPASDAPDPKAYLESWKAAWIRTEELIESAHALILPSFKLLTEPRIVEKLHARVNAGQRILIMDSPNHLDEQNRFLSFYGLAFTPLVLHSGEAVIRIRRAPSTYRDGALFAGVQEIRVQRPTLVTCRGESLPTLFSDGDEMVVDAETDLRVDMSVAELCCAGAWHGEAGGAVLAWSGSFLHDPYVSITGLQLSGIDGNERLASNLLRFLDGHQREASAEPSAQEYARRIEVNLADFVVGTLKTSALGDWWYDGVPENIREECASRAEKERGRFPKEAYFDLINFKPIMERNWAIFQPKFEAVGLTKTKEKALSFLVRLNELRRLVGHPLKMHLSGYQFSAEELAFLREADRLVLKLASA